MRYKHFADALQSGSVVAISNEEWATATSICRDRSISEMSARLSSIFGDMAIIPFFSEDMSVAAKYNSFRHGNDRLFLDSIDLASSKIEFYESYAHESGTFPYFTRASIGKEKIIQECNELGVHDVVVKPSVGSGSEGVYKASVSVGESLDTALELSLNCAPSLESVIVMEYLPPQGLLSEVALNFVVISGRVEFLSIHRKAVQTLEPPFQDLRIASTTPSDEDTLRLREIASVIQRALKLRNGVVQAELRRSSSGQFVPIDVSLRPDGGLVPESIYAMHDVDLRMVHTLLQLNEVPSARALVNAASVRKICETALGAFHYQSIGPETLEMLRRIFHGERNNMPDIVSGLYALEGSLMPLATNELKIGLCTKGETVDDAMATLEAVAASIALDGANPGDRTYRERTPL